MSPSTPPRPSDPAATQPDSPAGPSRRHLLAGMAATGVGGLALAATDLPAAAAATTAAPAPAGRPPREASRAIAPFTVAVMPDTQYLFDGAAIHPEPVQAALRWIKAARERENIVFLAHLGDLTQNGKEPEMRAIRRAFDSVGRLGMPVSTLTGNHDVDAKTDDRRGPTPYLTHFRPRPGAPGLLAASPDGYNSAYGFTAGGRDWLVLALDWRPSDAGLAWARGVLGRYPHRPTILTTHEIVQADTGDGVGVLSEHGTRMWNGLIRDHDQIFLTLNGHFWPTGRLTKTNAAGHDVQLHLTNYQEKYYGGGAMIRLYRFDPERKVVDVETFSPWVRDMPATGRNELAEEELVVSGDVERFTFPLDPDTRFAGFSPTPQRPARPAKDVLVPGTLAYWRWDGRPALTPGSRVVDLSGHGNDLEVVGHGAALTVVDDHHPGQPGHAAVRFAAGDHLRTRAGSPLDAETFGRGYTVEAFFRLPATWGDPDAWTSLLSREGSAKEAGRVLDDPDEPVATLSVSGSRELQWCVYPTSGLRSLTNWGHELRLDRWWHVAVVNDTKHTVMYIDGCPVARNPATRNRGLSSLRRGWLLGAIEYAGKLDKVTRVTVGDVRVCGRSLDPREFMIAGR